MDDQVLIQMKSNEIKRLHQACRAKDENLKDCISTLEVILKRCKNLTPAERLYYNNSVIEFKKGLL